MDSRLGICALRPINIEEKGLKNDRFPSLNCAKEGSGMTPRSVLRYLVSSLVTNLSTAFRMRSISDTFFIIDKWLKEIPI
jgi:hypothetical protein